MRKIIFLLLTAPLFIAGSCDDDIPVPEAVGDVEITFKANYDGELLLMGTEYDYTDDIPVRFSALNFFVANISLIEDETSMDETELVEIDFVDLSFNEQQETEALAGVTISAMQVPAGSYRGFKIGFGVPADLNRTEPNDYGQGDVLSTSTHYWSGWSSYIFSKIEGIADIDGNGEFETSEGEGLTFHCGTDETYTERILFPIEPITVIEGQTLDLNLNIDLKMLFNMPIDQYDLNGDDLLDIETHRSIHSEADLLIGKQIMRNYSDATVLD